MICEALGWVKGEPVPEIMSIFPIKLDRRVAVVFLLDVDRKPRFILHLPLMCSEKACISKVWVIFSPSLHLAAVRSSVLRPAVSCRCGAEWTLLLAASAEVRHYIALFAGPLTELTIIISPRADGLPQNSETFSTHGKVTRACVGVDKGANAGFLRIVALFVLFFHPSKLFVGTGVLSRTSVQYVEMNKCYRRHCCGPGDMRENMMMSTYRMSHCSGAPVRERDRRLHQSLTCISCCPALLQTAECMMCHWGLHVLVTTSLLTLLHEPGMTSCSVFVVFQSLSVDALRIHFVRSCHVERIQILSHIFTGVCHRRPERLS